MTNTPRERVLWFTLIAGLLGVTIMGLIALLDPPAPPLEPLAQLPPFTLTTERNEPLSLGDLEGSVWVAGFLFTRCQGICPRLAVSLHTLQEELDPGDPWRLIAFSVDPDHDQPGILAAYGEAHGADPSRWTFLTGPRETLWDLIGTGFLLGVAEGGPEDTELIVHTQKLVLVDRSGTIRGYYDGLDAQDLERLLRDTRRVLAEPA